MTLDAFFGIGETVTLGSHLFTPEEIVAFATKYDPQPFHMDAEKAKNSVFGSLCASGWHTAAMWMRYNLQKPSPNGWQSETPEPEFGPSPGFKNLKWLKPVYAGETITFKRTGLAHRPIASRPGWRLVSIVAEAFDSTGDKVLEFESAVLVKVD